MSFIRITNADQSIVTKPNRNKKKTHRETKTFIQTVHNSPIRQNAIDPHILFGDTKFKTKKQQQSSAKSTRITTACRTSTQTPNKKGIPWKGSAVRRGVNAATMAAGRPCKLHSAFSDGAKASVRKRSMNANGTRKRSGANPNLRPVKRRYCRRRRFAYNIIIWWACMDVAERQVCSYCRDVVIESLRRRKKISFYFARKDKGVISMDFI